MSDAIEAYEAAEIRMCALQERIHERFRNGPGYVCCGSMPTQLDLEYLQARRDHCAARSRLQLDVADAGDLDLAAPGTGAAKISATQSPGSMTKFWQRWKASTR